MAKTNVPRRLNSPKTHEGARAKIINPEQQLRRSVMACLLWESQFYEDGISIADRIAETIPLVSPEIVSSIAIEARDKMKLRHVPLWIVRNMASIKSHKKHVAETLSRVIQRADELTEFVSLYWKDGKQPLSAQVKKGLAMAFPKFDAYQLAKYDRDGVVKLRDVLFLCHAKPKSEEQDALWKQLIDGTLPGPDTWEVALSSGGDKKQHWTRLLEGNRLGGLAILRNLRNMQQASVDENLINQSIKNGKFKRVLPFRFIAAAKYNPHIEPAIENAMLSCLEDKPKLFGKTVLLIDSSGSMYSSLSGKSQLNRHEAACGLAILCREICENVKIFDFAGDIHAVPNRRGFGLRDAIRSPHNGTQLGAAVSFANTLNPDRIICLTDEQSANHVPDPVNKGYMVNVASYQNGVGYAKWTHIDGWSEAIIDYIHESE